MKKIKYLALALIFVFQTDYGFGQSKKFVKSFDLIQEAEKKYDELKEMEDTDPGFGKLRIEIIENLTMAKSNLSSPSKTKECVLSYYYARAKLIVIQSNLRQRIDAEEYDSKTDLFELQEIYKDPNSKNDMDSKRLNRYIRNRGQCDIDNFDKIGVDSLTIVRVMNTVHKARIDELAQRDQGDSARPSQLEIEKEAKKQSFEYNNLHVETDRLLKTIIQDLIKHNIPVPKDTKIRAYREGPVGEHLMIDYEYGYTAVGVTPSLDIGKYITDASTTAVVILKNLLENLKTSKDASIEIKDLEASFSGTADGIPVKKGALKYKGEFGSIVNYKYYLNTDKSPQTMTLNNGDDLDNIGLAFLRAYHAKTILEETIKSIDKSSIKIIVETTSKTGPQYRKVDISLSIKDAYKKVFTKLNDLAKEGVKASYSDTK